MKVRCGLSLRAHPHHGKVGCSPRIMAPLVLRSCIEYHGYSPAALLCAATIERVAYQKIRRGTLLREPALFETQAQQRSKAAWWG
ncbi:MAG: hypothetical protein ACREUA_07510 [Burkholderiales bacterium]